MDKFRKTEKNDETETPPPKEKREFPKKQSRPSRDKRVGLKPTVASPMPTARPAGSRPLEPIRPSPVPAPLKNDPMFDEIDCENFVGLTEHRARRTYKK